MGPSVSSHVRSMRALPHGPLPQRTNPNRSADVSEPAVGADSAICSRELREWGRERGYDTSQVPHKESELVIMAAIPDTC